MKITIDLLAGEQATDLNFAETIPRPSKPQPTGITLCQQLVLGQNLKRLQLECSGFFRCLDRE